MAETAQSVEDMLAKRAEYAKFIAEIDARLKAIQTEIQKALGAAGGAPGRPGRKPGRKPAATLRTPQAPDADKKKLLAAMREIGKPMRSGEAYKKAGLDKKQGKKAMAALRADKAVKVNGPWVGVA
jgi:hypothetical protein